MTHPDLYVYRAKLATPPHGGSGVYDGDTWWLWVDLGFDQWFRSSFRARSFDTPELRFGSDYEKAKGDEARTVALGWMEQGPFLIRTFKASEAHDVDEAGKYGRWLADPFRDGEPLFDILQMDDLATEWPTRWRDVYDVEAPS